MRTRPRSRFENEQGAINMGLVGTVKEYPEVETWDTDYANECDRLATLEAQKTGYRAWGRWYLDTSDPRSLNSKQMCPGINGKPDYCAGEYWIEVSRIGPNGESDGSEYTWQEHLSQKVWIGTQGIEDLDQAIKDLVCDGIIKYPFESDS